jgi:hypothetical protein
MPCFVGCLALFMPRVALVLVMLFSDMIGQAYESFIWPLLGFFFMPVTTLGYAWVAHGDGAVKGGEVAVVILAALVDFGVVGFGASRRMRED